MAPLLLSFHLESPACHRSRKEDAVSVTLMNSDTHLCPFVWSVVKNLPEMQKTWVRSLGQEDLLEKGMAIHSSVLPGEFHGWKATVHWVAKNQT